MKVTVRNNDISQATKTLKRKAIKEGLIREARQKREYEKPSALNKRQRQDAIRRIKKQATKGKERFF